MTARNGPGSFCLVLLLILNFGPPASAGQDALDLRKYLPQYRDLEQKAALAFADFDPAAAEPSEALADFAGEVAAFHYDLLKARVSDPDKIFEIIVSEALNGARYTEDSFRDASPEMLGAFLGAVRREARTDLPTVTQRVRDARVEKSGWERTGWNILGYGASLLTGYALYSASHDALAVWNVLAMPAGIAAAAWSILSDRWSHEFAHALARSDVPAALEGCSEVLDGRPPRMPRDWKERAVRRTGSIPL